MHIKEKKQERRALPRRTEELRNVSRETVRADGLCTQSDDGNSRNRCAHQVCSPRALQGAGASAARATPGCGGLSCTERRAGRTVAPVRLHVEVQPAVLPPPIPGRLAALAAAARVPAPTQPACFPKGCGLTLPRLLGSRAPDRSRNAASPRSTAGSPPRRVRVGCPPPLRCVG